jgi:hypothetical protein
MLLFPGGGGGGAARVSRGWELLPGFLGRKGDASVPRRGGWAAEVSQEGGGGEKICD